MLSKVLTDDQIKKIHHASLDILQRIGVHIPHKDMLSLFADSGADVDMPGQIVKIPADLITKCIDQAQKQYILYGRDISKKAEFGYGKRNYNSIAGEASWIDNIGDDRRFTNLDDVTTATRFADGLENITIPGALSDPAELDVSWRCVAVLAEMIKNTTKPVTLWLYDRASAKYICELLIALHGDEKKAAQYPLTYNFLEPISPLRFPFDGIDLLFEISPRLNLPVAIGPMAQMGLSAPATIAGTMATDNAEILAGICITQLIRPGAPVCYGGICHAFDMTTTQMIFAGPEQAIFGVGMTQMGKYYGFPVYVNVGLTDSKCVDAQAGLESGVTLAMAAAAGADIFGHMGICGVDQAASLDIMMMQHEIISYIESMMRQVDISDDALGIDVLQEVGPGGILIDRMHTVEHFRKELWSPKLLDRNYYQAWLDGGATNMQQRCKAMKDDILKNHQPEPVSKELEKLLDEVVAAAKKDLGGK